MSPIHCCTAAFTLLMATELRRHYKFLEECALSALISREAALELLRRKLSAAAGERWRLDDMLAHMAETFPTWGAVRRCASDRLGRPGHDDASRQRARGILEPGR